MNLQSYFRTQAKITNATKERIKKINDKTNQNNKIHSTFDTDFNFTNVFLQNFDHLKEDKIEHNNKPKINPIINTIHNVYQPSYVNAHKTTGFGDFIRGCLYVLEFCDKFQIKTEFHIKNHILKKYLNYFHSKPEIDNIISSNIEKFNDINANFNCKHNKINYFIKQETENKFIKYLNSCPIYKEHIFINTINFPLHYISLKNKQFMQNLLEPTDELKREIYYYMNSLKLKKQTFKVYHVRVGDYFLDNQEQTIIECNLLNKILNIIKIEPQCDYILITDSIIFKRLIMTFHKQLKCVYFDISHTCENDILTLKNTLIDFYIMSFASEIISMSVYPHGSGFSKWCSVVYNIPYSCTYLPT